MTVVIMTQPVGGRGGVLEPWSSDTYVLSHWMEWGKAGEKAQRQGGAMQPLMGRSACGVRGMKGKEGWSD